MEGTPGIDPKVSPTSDRIGGGEPNSGNIANLRGGLNAATYLVPAKLLVAVPRGKPRRDTCFSTGYGNTCQELQLSRSRAPSRSDRGCRFNDYTVVGGVRDQSSCPGVAIRAHAAYGLISLPREGCRRGALCSASRLGSLGASAPEIGERVVGAGS